MHRMEQGANRIRRPRMRKGKVPDNITCCCFSFDETRSHADSKSARVGLEIPA